MNRENRRYPREKMSAEVTYKNEKTRSLGGCVAKDVSERGVCIKIAEFFPVGTELDLEFKLPLSEKAFYVRGIIRWINKSPYNEQWEAGLEMVIDETYTKLVRKYISSPKPDNLEELT